MSTATGPGTAANGNSFDSAAGVEPRHGTETIEPRHTAEPRRSSETKASFKTTELLVFIAAVVGVLVGSYLVKTTGAHADYFRADKAWFYIVLLSLGYMVSRGLAKSGSRQDHR